MPAFAIGPLLLLASALVAITMLAATWRDHDPRERLLGGAVPCLAASGLVIAAASPERTGLVLALAGASWVALAAFVGRTTSLVRDRAAAGPE